MIRVPHPLSRRTLGVADALARALVAGAVGVLSAGTAAASEADDPMWSLLQARGLVAAPSVPASDPAVDAGAGATQLVLAAMNFLDIHYRFGGSTVEEGFDCSGFTRHVFETALGVTLPRRAAEQAHDPALHAIDRQDLRPGDLVFFNTLRRAFSHVGLYIGDGRFVHAPRSGAQVRVESLRTRYWASRYDGARRIGAPVGAPGMAGTAGEAFSTASSPN